MNTNILYIFTRTPLHVGAGSSVGAIDQPVMRERHTGFPIIPGSSIKGVFADYFLERENGKVLRDEDRNASLRKDDAERLLGLGEGKRKETKGKSGSLSFCEANVLAFPVRSARGCFAWLTSPLALSRWARIALTPDEARSFVETLPKPSDNEAYFDKDTLGSNAIFEDLLFEWAGAFEPAERLSRLIADAGWSEQSQSRLALVSDELLGHFCRNACEVAQHVVIDDETGTAKPGLLFNQENVPAETLFCSAIYGPVTDFQILSEKIGAIAQLGGDASTGLGFCSLEFAAGKEAVHV